MAKPWDLRHPCHKGFERLNQLWHAAYAEPRTLGQARTALRGFISSFDGQPAVSPVLLGAAALLKAQAKLAQLKDVRWIDEATRAVAVDFALYNTNTQLLSAVRTSWIFDNTGLVDTGFFILARKVNLYSKQYTSSLVRAFCELVVVG